MGEAIKLENTIVVSGLSGAYLTPEGDRTEPLFVVRCQGPLAGHPEMEATVKLALTVEVAASLIHHLQAEVRDHDLTNELLQAFKELAAP